MTWWNEKAARLQTGVRVEEADQFLDYTEEEVRRAIVHARQDIVLLVGNLDAVNTQLWTIKALLAAVALILLLTAVF